MRKEMSLTDRYASGGFPTPPFELDLRDMEVTIGQLVDNSHPEVVWNMYEHEGALWTQAERHLVVPSRAAEVVVAQALGPRPSEVGNVLYRVDGFGGSLRWPAGTELLDEVSGGNRDYVVDTIDFFAQCLSRTAPALATRLPQ